ncbi:uncharacterized protein DUF421 [Mesonia algae]|uniref:Uncharacterized protein DUF421 n=1 Tax=Mesonia algae TaxID=213248 RepID=A0A2W7I018_9FLAO|nr:YetF domain-containing protein [Mesonia algae]PZW39668.1 uncharacterized protein DUF421 [Mesonia algae]
MKEWFTASATSLYAIILTAIGIYICTIVYTRLAGKRSFSKMSSFDFAMTVAIGSILATTILSKSTSLLQGAIGLASVYVLQLFVALLRRNKQFQRLVDNKPVLLMDGQEILHENLKKSHVTLDDLKSKLREANVLELSQVRAVIFEATGDIAVLHTKDENQRIEDFILEDVKR